MIVFWLLLIYSLFIDAAQISTTNNVIDPKDPKNSEIAKNIETQGKDIDRIAASIEERGNKLEDEIARRGETIDNAATQSSLEDGSREVEQLSEKMDRRIEEKGKSIEDSLAGRKFISLKRDGKASSLNANSVMDLAISKVEQQGNVVDEIGRQIEGYESNEAVSMRDVGDLRRMASELAGKLAQSPDKMADLSTVKRNYVARKKSQKKTLLRKSEAQALNNDSKRSYHLGRKRFHHPRVDDEDAPLVHPFNGFRHPSHPGGVGEAETPYNEERHHKHGYPLPLHPPVNAPEEYEGHTHMPLPYPELQLAENATYDHHDGRHHSDHNPDDSYYEGRDWRHRSDHHTVIVPQQKADSPEHNLGEIYSPEEGNMLGGRHYEVESKSDRFHVRHDTQSSDDSYHDEDHQAYRKYQHDDTFPHHNEVTNFHHGERNAYHHHHHDNNDNTQEEGRHHHENHHHSDHENRQSKEKYEKKDGSSRGTEERKVSDPYGMINSLNGRVGLSSNKADGWNVFKHAFSRLQNDIKRNNKHVPFHKLFWAQKRTQAPSYYYVMHYVRPRERPFSFLDDTIKPKLSRTMNVVHLSNFRNQLPPLSRRRVKTNRKSKFGTI